MMDGFYYINSWATVPPYLVYCKVLGGTAWTMVLNLATSDGHVMWWGNNLWQNSATYGNVTPAYAFQTDIKSPAWNSLGSQNYVMLMVHQQGVMVGYRSWCRSTGYISPMYTYYSAGNCISSGSSYCNQVLGDTAHLNFVSNINNQEVLVRTSAKLYYNFGQFSGSPDMSRLGSPEASP